MESNKIKKSKISWFGNVPFDWEEYQIKHLFDIGRGRVISILDMKDEGKYPVFSSQTLNNGIMGYVDTYDFDGEYLTWTTDGVYAGTIFKRKGKFNCTNICGTLKVKDNRKINIDFAKYSLEYVTEYCKRPDTNGAKIMNNEMAAIKIYLPNLNEQHKIADFLDTKCQKINDTIEKINKQIEVLKKYKQSLITEVVTKGLDKNAPMKDSGVDWIGKIPKNWDLIYVKHNCWLKGRIGWDGLQSSEYCEDGPYLITGTDFNNGIIDWNACVHISKERFEEDVALHIKENDLLITKDGTIGKVAVAKNCPEEVSLNSGVLLIRNVGKYKINSRYMYYVLISNQFIKWYEISQAGNSTIKHLYQEQFYNFKYTLPKMDDQNQIVDFLDKKCAKIDAIIDKKSKQIEILERYKKSLIYEYVTGKKRVD